MQIWLELHYSDGGATVLVNMNRVESIAWNNPEDEAQGSALYFGTEDALCVKETYSDIHTRLGKNASKP
jgi:hypothetical protein